MSDSVSKEELLSKEVQSLRELLREAREDKNKADQANRSLEAVNKGYEKRIDNLMSELMQIKDKKSKRVGWDEYFMNIATVVASRATCDRKHVGAVIVSDRNMLATGYNGSLAGSAHCDDAGHLMEDGHCVRTIHAEANAIIQAAKNGVSIDGATIYVTASPCFYCFKLIANAGIKRIVYKEFYRDQNIFDFAKELGIELVLLSEDETE